MLYSAALKFQLFRVNRGSTYVLHSIMPIVNSTVLCTSKYVIKVDLMVNVHTILKESRARHGDTCSLSTLEAEAGSPRLAFTI